jgi:hypothetical protein
MVCKQLMEVLTRWNVTSPLIFTIFSLL